MDFQSHSVASTFGETQPDGQFQQCSEETFIQLQVSQLTFTSQSMKFNLLWLQALCEPRKTIPIVPLVTMPPARRSTLFHTNNCRLHVVSTASATLEIRQHPPQRFESITYLVSSFNSLFFIRPAITAVHTYSTQYAKVWSTCVPRITTVPGCNLANS